MTSALSAIMTLITTAWTTILTWTPVIFGIGFVIVKFALGGLSKISGFRRKRGRR